MSEEICFLEIFRNELDIPTELREAAKLEGDSSVTLDTSHKSGGTTPRKPPGRPPDTNRERDAKIAEAWRSGLYNSYAEGVRELWGRFPNLTEKELRLAVGRAEGATADQPDSKTPPSCLPSGRRPMTDGEKQVWDLLDGRALTGKGIVNALHSEKGIITSEDTVRQHILELRKAGYSIPNQRGRGYYREDSPPPEVSGR